MVDSIFLLERFALFQCRVTQFHCNADGKSGGRYKKLRKLAEKNQFSRARWGTPLAGSSAGGRCPRRGSLAVADASACPLPFRPPSARPGGHPARDQ